MKKFTNKRNPILPLEYHIPDSEGHVMPDGNLYIVYCSENIMFLRALDHLTEEIRVQWTRRSRSTGALLFCAGLH